MPSVVTPPRSEVFDYAMTSAEAFKHLAEHRMMRGSNHWHTIDEISLLWYFSAEHSLFQAWADRQGFVFNEVVEEQQDLGSEETFRTKFTFIKKPEWDWRIESMVVLDGSAPLHYSLSRRFGPVTVAHASWKCQSPDGYSICKKKLGNYGFEFAKEYKNGYGQFAYYRYGTLPFYFKPRVNLRDQ